MKYPNTIPNRYSSVPQVALLDQRGDRKVFVNFRQTQPLNTRRQYRVKDGDTLQSVASVVYGYPEMWFVLFENNLDKLKHPSDLVNFVGDTINIPETSAGNY